MEEDIASLTKSPERSPQEQVSWTEHQKNEAIVITEVGEPGSHRGVEFDLDPRLLEVDNKIESAEDTHSILVDENDSSKVL